MSNITEIQAEILSLTPNQIGELNFFLDNPIGVKTISTNQDLEDLADEINGLNLTDYNALVIAIDNSGTVKGGRRPC